MAQGPLAVFHLRYLTDGDRLAFNVDVAVLVHLRLRLPSRGLCITRGCCRSIELCPALLGFLDIFRAVASGVLFLGRHLVDRLLFDHLGGPKLTVGSTVFEMWLGHLPRLE